MNMVDVIMWFMYACVLFVIALGLISLWKLDMKVREKYYPHLIPKWRKRVKRFSDTYEPKPQAQAKVESKIEPKFNEPLLSAKQIKLLEEPAYQRIQTAGLRDRAPKKAREMESSMIREQVSAYVNEMCGIKEVRHG